MWRAGDRGTPENERPPPPPPPPQSPPPTADVASLVPVVLLGDSGVGKTTAVITWATGAAPDTPPPPTVGADPHPRTLLIGGARRVAATLWDCGGRDAALRLGRAFWVGAAAFVIAWDASAGEGAEEVASTLEWWASAVAARAPVGGPLPPLIVLGVAKRGGPPPHAPSLAAAARWAAARGATAFVDAPGAAACGRGAAAALDAAVAAGASYVAAADVRAAFWGAGDTPSSAADVLRVLATLGARVDVPPREEGEGSPLRPAVTA